ncbi:MAG: family 43 glycosylhydrolase, partial [Anaerolinea sp.]|nr:family 43 glycosylhydrolase [Anaerolinea sp.]
EQDGIDPSLLFDVDGRVYLTSTGSPPGIYQSEIDLTTGRCLTPPRLIWRGTGGRYPEGPHLYHIGGFYYLLISEGGTEYAHRVTLARATSPWGTFEPCPHNPIFTHMDQPENPLQATGHADLVQDQRGNWWMVCLAVRPTQRYFPTHHLGRETILVPAAWDERKWLVVNSGSPADLVMEADTLPAQRTQPNTERDDFDHSVLDFRLNFIRTPDESCWSLRERPGWLRLRGSGATLNDAAAPTFIGRRQQHFRCMARVLLDFEPQTANDEAGLTVYQNEDHHYELAIIREDDQRHIVVRQRIGTLTAVTARQSLPSGTVTLLIEADTLEYRFAYAGSDHVMHPLATARTRYLSSEVAGGFTGVYIGMYVYGAAPADFDWFEYCPQVE